MHLSPPHRTSFSWLLASPHAWSAIASSHLTALCLPPPPFFPACMLMDPMPAVPIHLQVDVLWVFNQQAKNWENSLPKATRTKLETERRGLVNANSVVPRETTTQSLGGWGRINTLHRFPYFTTYALDYNNAATNMLSQLASWVMMEAAGELQDMMRKAGSVMPQTEE